VVSAVVLDEEVTVQRGEEQQLGEPLLEAIAAVAELVAHVDAQRAAQHAHVDRGPDQVPTRHRAGRDLPQEGREHADMRRDDAVEHPIEPRVRRDRGLLRVGVVRPLRRHHQLGERDRAERHQREQQRGPPADEDADKTHHREHEREGVAPRHG
jgi:hypothetical protein